MRRGRFDAGGGLFFLILLFVFVGNILSGMLSILMFLLPIGIAAYLIYKFAKKDDTVKTYNGSHVSKQSNDNTFVSKLSVGELNKIDKKLNSYFKNNLTLPVIDGITLTTNGKFTTVDQLFLAYKDEKICKLGEFKYNYPDVYKKIMDLLLVFSTKSDDVLKTNVEAPKVKKEDKLSDANKYIDKIDELNRAIPQEEITNGLYQTCDLLKQIDILSESHSDDTKVSKLYDYYLPILTSALEKYKKLQDAPVHGEDFNKCEAQLIKTIVLINEALKTICSSMQEDDYMNINADMNTLQSLLKKDGYGENPFGGKK